jgi:integrase
VKIPDDVQKVWREIEESDDLANNALGVSVIRSWLADAAVPLETELETNGEPAAKTPVDIAAESQSEAHWCAPLTREPTTLVGRAATASKRMNAKRKEAELDPITPIGLHECRHTLASLMIAVGVNAKALSTYVGHSSITITLDPVRAPDAGQRDGSRRPP